MRLFREFSRRNAAGVRTPQNPTALTVTTSTVAGVPIENLTPVNDGAVGRYRVDTADTLLYTNGTVYRVAWAATMNGTTFTRTLRYRHVTPQTGDLTPPGPPTIGTPLVSSDNAAFPFTAPADADYNHVTVVAWPFGGGAPVSATGTGASGTVVLALAPSTSYIWEARAYDTSGNGSLPAAGTVGSLTTLTASTVARPLLLKFFVNNEDVQHDNSPFPFDIEHEQGGLTVGSDYAPMGTGEVAELLIEGNHYNDWGLLDITLRYLEPDSAPFGVGDKYRTR